MIVQMEVIILNQKIKKYLFNKKKNIYIYLIIKTMNIEVGIILFLLSVSSIVFLILFLTKKCKSHDNNCPSKPCPKPPPCPTPPPCPPFDISKIEKEFKTDISKYKFLTPNMINDLYNYNKYNIIEVYTNNKAKKYFEQLLNCKPVSLLIIILNYIYNYITKEETHNPNLIIKFILLYYISEYYINYSTITLDEYCKKIACDSNINIISPFVKRKDLIDRNIFPNTGPPQGSKIENIISLLNLLFYKKQYHLTQYFDSKVLVPFKAYINQLITNNKDYNCLDNADPVTKKLVFKLVDSLMFEGFIKCILEPDSCSFSEM